jgi:hypothetical protein
MGKKMPRSTVLLITVAFAVVFATFDLLVKAQDPANQNATSNTQNSNTKRTRGSRQTGTKPSSKAAAATGVAQDPSTPSASEATPAMQTETTTATSPRTTSRKRRGRPTTTATDMAATGTAQTEQTDLSGTYTGNFTCDEIGMTGDTTLTINGNQFTTADGKTGRIVASTTRGYTAVALQAGDTGTPTTGTSATTPPRVISLRARKSGDRLTLMPVAGSTQTCSFMPSRTVASRRRSRRAPQPQQPVPAATGTEVTSPAEAGPTPADVTAPRTPTRGKTRRGNVRPTTADTTVSPSTMPSPTTVPSPTPSESPAPVPTPSESPAPSPTPTPTPSESPAPSPTPTPSESPAPSPTPTPSGSPVPSPTPTPPPTSPRPSRG